MAFFTAIIASSAGHDAHKSRLATYRAHQGTSSVFTATIGATWNNMVVVAAIVVVVFLRWDPSTNVVGVGRVIVGVVVTKFMRENIYAS